MLGYFAADGIARHEIVINRSRFIATVSPIENYTEAIKFIAGIKKEYSAATHNCYAFISNEIGTEQRFSDDGEPQGTAGQPMLEVLKKRDIRMTAVVVTRYFGGVKLGAGGLVSAYTRAVAEALDSCRIVRWHLSRSYTLKCDYTNYQTLQNALKDMNHSILNTEYGDQVTVSAAFPEDEADNCLSKITDALSGNISAEDTGHRYEKYNA